MKVLVVDDDADIRHVVRSVVEREGFDVEEAADGAEAISRLELAGPFDVAVLDLHLPDVSGLDLLGRLRARDPDLRVIMLTGAGSEADRVLGLVSGADDYVVKPFSTRELAARVIACSRRRPVRANAVLAFDDLRIDPTARTVTVGGASVDLPRRELDLLVYLASHPGRTFTREHLLHAVWGSSASWQRTTTVTEHVRRLRNKIEADPLRPERVLTVRGTGYRFEPDVPRTAEPPATSRAQESQDATVVIVGTTVTYASSSTLALVGASRPEEIVGHDVFEFVAPQSVGATRARHESASEGRWPRPELITLKRLDGVEVLVELASSPVTWEGQPASQVTMWDLAGDTARLRTLATGIRADVSDAVIITTNDYCIQSFNDAAEDLYGWTERDVLGRRTTEVIPWTAGDAHDQARIRLFEDGRWYGEAVQTRRDGGTVRVRASKTLLRDSVGVPVGIISVNRPALATHDRHRVADDPDGDLDADIRRGIEQNEFIVHYQPVVWLATGQRGGVEALVRWQHPERGLLEPEAFMTAVERSGAIIELGDVVLRAACRQVQVWRAAGHDLHLAVNLSARQLADDCLPDRLSEVMAATAIPDGKLWLEVTETALVQDLEQATRVLGRIEKLGACVSIDDFGTGWASLTYLREFSVHALKIDKLFVHGLDENPRDTTIVRSIISLGRELGVATVAEGVETEAQRHHLLDLGCEIAQGYLFGYPLAAEELGRTFTL